MAADCASVVCEQMPASPSGSIMSTFDQEISVVFPLPGLASQMPAEKAVQFNSRNMLRQGWVLGASLSCRAMRSRSQKLVARA